MKYGFKNSNSSSLHYRNMNTVLVRSSKVALVKKYPKSYKFEVSVADKMPR